ncbi:MAG: DNA-directed RNA polymerase subunit E'' [Candidatus Heimdallarchaeota archaeon]|nr:DNA-directed RNA polymerase subunit E'' [Candidatus Heimdallarchaeota archaeon]
MKKKACKKCNSIVDGEQVCPICKTHNHLSKSFSGMVIIRDIDKSKIARKLNIKRPGKYAIKVR